MCGLLLLATAAFGGTKLKSGLCNQKSDSTDNQTCDMGTKECIDGTGGSAGTGGAGGKGGAGGAAGSHGTGGTTFTCPNITCSGGTPFCDMTAGGCRGCESEGPNACQ